MQCSRYTCHTCGCSCVTFQPSFPFMTVRFLVAQSWQCCRRMLQEQHTLKLAHMHTVVALALFTVWFFVGSACNILATLRLQRVLCDI
jgi:hypothetical protein